MPKYELVVEVDRLKNLAETLTWKCVKEVYQDDSVVISFLKVISAKFVPLSP